MVENQFKQILYHHIEISCILKEKRVMRLDQFLSLKTKAAEEIFNGLSLGVPNGIRTRVAGLKGRRPRPG
jgi:hypothetical protein